ncbi:enoyl-CoA hydratase [Pseudozyma hubeiensis SY62]|uniref:Enoyl-CoA hydratase n=1 Tax=Pseudozyma hubeiensis (strain SY62) TaxID=1305764 RepID=R9PA79_PSEHS|nr:enoyl-CoA hydratase [Pseudozyma hubeiensis SY62]GAC98254.1 enoyl-CoA hydratase [Pseudozyma hubeiensis SY62]
MADWEQVSLRLRTRRPQADILIISLVNGPYNFLDRQCFDELNAIIAPLDIKTTRAVILTGGVKDIFVLHYNVDEIIDFGLSVPSWLPTPPFMLRAALRLESMIASLGLRFLVRKTLFAGVADLNLYKEVCNLFRSKPQVFIAAINGACFAGGCEFALACDYRVLIDTQTPVMGQIESLIGLIPGGGGTQFFSRTLGTAKALELCLEGKTLNSSEALELGLVNRVTPAEDLLPTAIEVAQRLARRSPYVIQAIKDSIHIGSSLTLSDGLLREQGWFGGAALMAETHEAMKKYARLIEEERPHTLDDFQDYLQPFANGTFFDFTPGSAKSATSTKTVKTD